DKDIGSMKTGILRAILSCLVSCAALAAQTPAARPQVLGISHLGFYTSNLAATEAFWENLLGFQSPYVLRKSDGQVRIAFIKINNRQHIELFNQKPPTGVAFFSHIAFITDNARQMYAYLKSRGVEVPPHWGSGQSGGKGKTGDLNFEVRDPDGHLVEFVQYAPDDWRSKRLNQDIPPTRIADSIMHAGFTVGNVEKSEAFYEGILGFTNFWQGSANHGRSLSWVDLRVPNGSDYIELMLYGGSEPPARRLGTMDHVCLLVPHIHRVVAEIEARPAYKTYGKPIVAKTGVNHKWQANLFDPDGTRIELMEPDTYDGKPVPSSNAPPPRASRQGKKAARPG
ncbi:MAG: VOC family protein, partial [Terriglobia bacterium]